MREQDLSKGQSTIVWLEVLGIEVVQSIQSLAHDIELLAHMKTLVRVYVRPQDAVFTVNVSGILEIAGPTGGAVSIRSINHVALKAQGHPGLDSQRDNLGESLSFVLPADWLQPGETTFKLGAALPTLTSDPAIAIMETGRSQQVGVLENARSVVFVEGPRLRICTVGLKVQDPETGAIHMPQPVHAKSLRSYLLRAFPVSSVDMGMIVIDAAPGFAPPYGDDSMTIGNHQQAWQDKFILGCAQLMAIRARDVDAGVDQRTHYYGLVAHPFDFFVGAVSDVPATARPDVIGLGPALVETGSYGAHEIAHTLGALHPGFCYGQSREDRDFPEAYNGRLSSPAEMHHAVDVGNGAEPPQLLKFDQYHDLMTYCEPTWVSAYTYRRLLARLREEDALGQGAPPGRYLHVVLTYDLDTEPGTGVLRHVFPTGAPLPAVEGQESVICVVGEDKSGTVLFEAHAEPIRRDALDLHQRSGATQLTVPRVDELYELRLVVNGVVSDTLTWEPMPSEDIGLFPAGSVTLAAHDSDAEHPGGSLSIHWPEDLADDRKHTVQVRAQDRPWRTIAVGITRQTVSVHLDEAWLDLSSPPEVRILQTFGFLERAVFRGPVVQSGLVKVQIPQQPVYVP